MRKTLLTMFIALMGVGANVAHAQVCTPDPTALFLGIPGIYPNPAITSNLTAGNQGQAYSETMTIMVPQDTTIDLSAFIGFPFPAISVSVNFQEVTAITGLPTGLNYTCDLSNCQWGGGVNGCIKLDGTPTQGGSFNVGMSTGYNVSVPQQVPVIGGSAITIPIPWFELDIGHYSRWRCGCQIGRVEHCSKYTQSIPRQYCHQLLRCQTDEFAVYSHGPHWQANAF
jgi:hypothetical protein